MEYTECSCHITLPKQRVKKSYIIESGAVGIITGLFAAIAFYVVWLHCGQIKNNFPSSNKIHDKGGILSIEDILETENDGTKSEYSDQSKSSDNSSKRDQIERQQGCDCFVDHTGYNHFQRRDKDDKHNYRYHKCRGRHSKFNNSLNASKC